MKMRWRAKNDKFESISVHSQYNQMEQELGSSRRLESLDDSVGKLDTGDGFHISTAFSGCLSIALTYFAFFIF